MSGPCVGLMVRLDLSGPDCSVRTIPEFSRLHLGVPPRSISYSFRTTCTRTIKRVRSQRKSVKSISIIVIIIHGTIATVPPADYLRGTRSYAQDNRISAIELFTPGPVGFMGLSIAFSYFVPLKP